jgi:hypothetical protein
MSSGFTTSTFSFMSPSTECALRNWLIAFQQKPRTPEQVGKCRSSALPFDLEFQDATGFLIALGPASV